MILRCIAFLFAALMLSNCCVSGTGCGGPPGGPVAWDGLVPVPGQAQEAAVQDTQPIELGPNQPNNKVRAKKPDTLSAVAAPEDADLLPRGAFKDVARSRSTSGDSWEHQQAVDRDDEARLKKKLIICRDCGANEPTRNDATVSAAR
jgi:hypothetical protein